MLDRRRNFEISKRNKKSNENNLIIVKSDKGNPNVILEHK